MLSFITLFVFFIVTRSLIFAASDSLFAIAILISLHYYFPRGKVSRKSGKKKP
jgi:hypothetical protein